MTVVVPRTGYVDRNVMDLSMNCEDISSYPARGTWIEMLMLRHYQDVNYVVPRTGYVDRNAERLDGIIVGTSRTPHGVRG